MNLLGIAGSNYFGMRFFIFHLGLNVLLALYLAIQKIKWAFLYALGWGLFACGMLLLFIGNAYPGSLFLNTYAPSLFHILELILFTVLIATRVLSEIHQQEKIAIEANDFRNILLNQLSQGTLHTVEYLEKIYPFIHSQKKINEEEADFFRQIIRMRKNWLNLNFITQKNTFKSADSSTPHLMLRNLINTYRLLYPNVKVQFHNNWDSLRSVRFHPDFELILLNLIDNAFRFSAQKPIVIQAIYQEQHMGESPKVILNIENQHQLQFSLPKTYKNPKRELSSRLHRSEGLGLGLINVQSAMDKTRGVLELEQTSKGIKIDLSWPLHAIEVFKT